MTQLHNRLMVRERCQWRIKGAGRAAATEPPGAQIYSAKIIDAVMCLAAEFKKKTYTLFQTHACSLLY